MRAAKDRFYMNMSLDEKLSKQMRLFLVEEFGNLQGISALMDVYVQRGMEQDALDPDMRALTIAKVKEVMEERKAARLANLAAARARV